MKKQISITNSLLEDISRALSDNSYEMERYLDIQKEETTFISMLFEEDQGSLPQMIEEDEDGERFIFIDGKPSHEAWKQMERFIMSLDDQDQNTRNLLLTNIQGKGAFSRFKDALYSIGLQGRWYEFKGREDRKEALDWLYACDLIADEDIEKGMQLYEEELKRRKQRDEEIANMTKGTRVKCTGAHGHERKLTVGKTYDVLDEQKEHYNIKIRDDRGKVCLLPKNHFELRG